MTVRPLRAPSNWDTTAAGVPGGTVTFKDGTTALGSASLDSSGKASLATTSLATGTHSLTVKHAGIAGFAHWVAGDEDPAIWTRVAALKN